MVSFTESCPEVIAAHRSALRSINRVIHETSTPTPPTEALQAVTRQLKHGKVLVLTGAGVSTDSGIPDYRGPQGSLSRHRPMTYQEFRFDAAALQRYWARSFIGWRYINTARPNRVHYAIATLQAHGLVSAVVTQNVDGLHQAAGSKDVLALHGDLATVLCLQCGHREARADFDARMATINPNYCDSITIDPQQVNPDGDIALAESDVQRFHLAGCKACGSTLMKPDVVYFGENVPIERKYRLSRLLADSRSVLVAGSSLAVMSGMKVVIEAKKQNKMVAAINGGPGRADDRVDILWRTQLEPAFTQVLSALKLPLSYKTLDYANLL